MFIAIISAKIAELIVSLGFAAVSTALIEILLYIRVADVLLSTAVLYLYSNTNTAILGFIYMSIFSVFALSFWLLVFSANPAVAAGLATASMISLFTGSIICISPFDLSLGVLSLCAVGVAVSLGAPMLVYAAELIVAHAALYSCLRFVGYLSIIMMDISMPKEHFGDKRSGFSGQRGYAPAGFDDPHENVFVY